MALPEHQDTLIKAARKVVRFRKPFVCRWRPVSLQRMESRIGQHRELLIKVMCRHPLAVQTPLD